MRKGVIYARYSSDSQTEQSIEGQVRVCNEYAERNQIEIIENYVDRSMTGTNDNRPDFKRMLADAKKKQWDCVLVYRFDRFSRNKYESVIHKKALKDLGISVISAMENIPDTPEGIILESLLEGLNQYYSAELSLKVKRGNRESRLKGNCLGGNRPYGYDIVDRKYVVNENEARVIRYIFKKFLSGLTTIEIAKRLNNRKIPYSKGKFSPGNIRKLLRREYLTGIYCCNDEYFYNLYPPIIEREIFKKVELLRKHKMFPRESGIIYILRFKLFCKECGNPFYAEAGSSHLSTRYRYYKCKGRKQLHICKSDVYPKTFLEDVITNTLIDFLSDKTNIDFIAKSLLERYKQHKNIEKVRKFKEEKRQCEIALNNIQKVIERGIYNATSSSKIQMLENRIELLKAEIAIEEGKESTKYSKDYIVRFYKKAGLLDGLEFINYLIDKINMDKKTMDIYLNIPYTGTFKDNKLIATLDIRKKQSLKTRTYIFKKTVSIYI